LEQRIDEDLSNFAEPSFHSAPTMKYRSFGRTDLRVSEIGHGLWGMGDWPCSQDDHSLNALRLAAAQDVNFFDSAWAYGNGRSDALLGKLLHDSNQSLIAASKVPPLNNRWPASAEDDYEEVFPRRHVLSCVDRIRRAHGRDFIDVLQFHVWDDRWTDSPSFRNTVEQLKSSGTVRAFGLSLNRWEPANGIHAVRTGLIDAVQVIYNIFDQSPEDELFPVCRDLKVGVIARVPLDEGSLSGIITLETRFPADDWRSRYFGPENLAPTVERVERLKEVLPAAMTLPEMALRFILSNPDVSTTIVGMRTREHVIANIACSDAGPLDPSLLAELHRHRWDRTPAPWSD
jgi:aryl-alcohol dehydrogenase-like predicted oxidoreductase